MRVTLCFLKHTNSFEALFLKLNLMESLHLWSSMFVCVCLCVVPTLVLEGLHWCRKHRLKGSSEKALVHPERTFRRCGVWWRAALTESMSYSLLKFLSLVFTLLLLLCIKIHDSVVSHVSFGLILFLKSRSMCLGFQAGRLSWFAFRSLIAVLCIEWFAINIEIQPTLIINLSLRTVVFSRLSINLFICSEFCPEGIC